MATNAGLIMNSLTGAQRSYAKRSLDDSVLLFPKKYDPLCHRRGQHAAFQKEPSAPRDREALLGRFKKGKRDRVMIYRRNGTRPGPRLGGPRAANRCQRERERSRTHRRGHLHFAAGQTEKRMECTGLSHGSHGK